jgi:NitT/TauT family transport system substrate-binding protein
MKVKSNRKYWGMSLTIILAAALSLVLGACGGGQAPVEDVTLKVAVLPIIDSLPMYVAQQEGLFEKAGVKVELVPVQSAAERDQLIAAGQADGMINELVSTQLYNKDQTQVQVVRFARTATPESPMFSILAAGGSGIQDAAGLKGVEIGISQGTVIEYLTDRLLEAQNFGAGDIKTIPVPKIADRMALLGTGELKAAMLPEPLASLAVQNGASVVLDDTSDPELSYSTIAFRKPVIDQYPGALRAFLAAIEEATTMINADPQKFSNLLVEQKVVPAPVAGIFQVPKFVTAGIPSQAQWDDVLAWAKAKGLIDKDVSYLESVTGEFLP